MTFLILFHLQLNLFVTTLQKKMGTTFNDYFDLTTSEDADVNLLEIQSYLYLFEHIELAKQLTNSENSGYLINTFLSSQILETPFYHYWPCIKRYFIS